MRFISSGSDFKPKQSLRFEVLAVNPIYILTSMAQSVSQAVVVTSNQNNPYDLRYLQ
jgi:hypothetical protein